VSRNPSATLSEKVDHLSLDVGTETSFPDTFLPDEVHGLVYCPGTIMLKPFRAIKPEQFETDFRINVLGAVKSIQWAQKKLAAGSSIVLFSTVAVGTGMPYHASIASAKGAIEGLTRSLAAEFAPRTRVNAIAPSLTDTPLAERLINSPERKKGSEERHPLKTIGQRSDMAAMAYFLLSRQSGWITGQILHVDGGISSIRT
jgi:NAD(P)-dependent dehydrogenase (short-subunit alcohol dehydrogenase family)